ncbi:hypothetical protein MTO96_037101 [Rhipicephalus appendiculatus]
MEPNRRQCFCMFCPECKKIASAKVRLWLQQQLVPTEVEQQKRESDAAGEASFSGAPILAAKCSAAADEAHAYAHRLLECKIDSIESADSGSRTDMSIVCCSRSSSGGSISQEGESSSQAVGEAVPVDPQAGPSKTTDSESIEPPRDGP